MSSAISPAVQKLIAQRMATGQYASEEALLLEALQALKGEDEDLAAIQAGLDSVDRGEPGVAREYPPVHRHFKNLVTNLVMPKSWMAEAVEPPTNKCRAHAINTLVRLFDTYGIIPYKVTVSKSGGVFAAYKSLYQPNTVLRIEVDNELDVVAVVSNGETISGSAVLGEDDAERSLIDKFESQLAHPFGVQ